jgi:signal transduction histidine kinase
VGTKLQLAGTWPDEARPGSNAQDLSPGGELPTFPEREVPFPVVHHGELLGAITVTASAGEPLTSAQEKLILDLASQAGLVLRSVRLTEELKANLAELKASRQRIVAAQDAERRRLERNLHDGAQQQLVALSMKLGLAGAMIGKDPNQAARLVDDLRTDTQEALDNLRDLARGVYPPLLADQGLVAALESQSRKVSVPLIVDGDGIGRYAQEVEAAVYFCTLEALQNVSKYAHASRIEVRIRDKEGELGFTITDDGEGFDMSATSYGTGLQGMVDRLAAQGGILDIRSHPGEGTTVSGRVPIDGRA